MSKTSNNPAKGGVKSGRLSLVFTAVAVLVIIFSGWAWWHSVRSDPQRTLHAAIENNLRTRSVTRQVVQSNGTQKLEQDVELSLSPTAVAQGSTTISQTGEVEATVKTESLSTPTDEYVRYTEIETSQKNPKGESLNFGELIGVWGRTSVEQTGQPGELYGESILGVIPTGNLNASNRKALMKTIVEKQVYQFDEAALERVIVDGRPTYVYNVTVAPSAYISVLKQFGSMVGLRQLEGLDPQQYANAQPLSFKLTVDVWGQKLTGVEYAGGERSESIGGYGLNHEVDFPKETIPVDELQAKLQAVQQ